MTEEAAGIFGDIVRILDVSKGARLDGRRRVLTDKGVYAVVDGENARLEVPATNDQTSILRVDQDGVTSVSLTGHGSLSQLTQPTHSIDQAHATLAQAKNKLGVAE